MGEECDFGFTCARTSKCLSGGEDAMMQASGDAVVVCGCAQILAARGENEALDGHEIHRARRPMWRETRIGRSAQSTDEVMK